MQDLTIVIPVKDPPSIDRFIRENLPILKAYRKIVVDSGGGEKLASLPNTEWIREEVPFWEARKLGYRRVNSPYILNLDADTILPVRYVLEA